MKKLFFLFLALMNFAFAQNVGIGTNAPSEKLEIKNSVRSTLKISSAGFGDTTQLILSNRNVINQGTDFSIKSIREEGLFFSSLSDIPANNSGNSLVILPNGNVGTGIIPTSKLHVSGDIKLEGLNLFEFGAGIAGKEINAGKIGYNAFGQSALTFVGAGTNSTNRAVYFFAEGGATFNGPLTVSGYSNFASQLRLNGNAGTAGQVLTSNGASSPSWQSIGNPQTGFHAEPAINQTLAQFAQTKINFTSENFDDGSDYNNGTSTFVAPATGVYHFDAHVTFLDADPGNYRLFLDNNTSIADGEYARSYYQVSDLGSTTISISITLKLTIGASVLVHAWHNATADQTVSFAYFSSHRLY
jgi:hypothetical protein